MIATNVLEHPAVRAWMQLHPDSDQPDGIDILKKRNNSEVYRLAGVHPNGSSVIAKRSQRVKSIHERAVYEDILPRLAISALSYYGFVEEPEGKYCWIFMEEACDEKYSSLSSAHCDAAAAWLAQLHTTSVGLAATANLPDHGPEYYLAHLQSAREKIPFIVLPPFRTEELLPIFKSMVRNLDILKSQWSEIEVICNRLPKTLVHGDSQSNNFRMKQSLNGVSLLAFDWEYAGCGFPATDLDILFPFTLSEGEQIAYDTSPSNHAVQLYWNRLRESWDLGTQNLEHFIYVARILTCLVFIDWKVSKLAVDWSDQSMITMKGYHSKLVDSMKAIRFAHTKTF